MLTNITLLKIKPRPVAVVICFKLYLEILQITVNQLRELIIEATKVLTDS